MLDERDTSRDVAATDAQLRRLDEQRLGLKNSFIAHKKAVNGYVDRIAKPDIASSKREALKALQSRYHVARDAYKQLGVESLAASAARSELMSGAADRAGARAAPAGSKNTGMLTQAERIAADTTGKLESGLQTLHETKAQADATALTLREDREKLARVNENLDQIEGDLAISNRLITNLLKRLYTDKVIICFTGLIMLSIVGIIIYSMVAPDQSTFSVPEDAKPPTKVPTRLLRGLLPDE